MKKPTTSKKSRTDWKRVDAQRDQEIDFSDIAELTPEMFARAVVRRGVKLVPRKEQLTIRGDRDVLDWYKKQGARLPNPHQCFAPRLYAGTSEEKHLTLVCTGAVTKMASAATGSASRYALGWYRWK